MTVIDRIDPDWAALPSAPEPALREQRPPQHYLRRGLIGVVILLVLLLLVTESKARSTLLTVLVAVAGSASVWIAANLLFNQVRGNWQRFTALLYASVTFIVTAILGGNRAIGRLPADDPVAKLVNKFVNGIREGTLTSRGFLPEFVSWIWLPLALSIGAGIVGLLLSRTDGLGPRLAVGAGGLGLLGVITGLGFNFRARPELDVVGLVAWTALGAGIAAGLGFLRRQEPVRATLLGTALGWVVGAFGAPKIGGGSLGWTVVAVAVPALIVGIRAAIRPNLALRDRGVIDTNSRKWIFLAPAMIFAFAMLVVPAASTFWLSFKDRDGKESVGTENYRNIFKDENSWNPPDDWKDIFRVNFFQSSTGGSRLMILGLITLAIFVVIGVRQKAQTGRIVELGSPSMAPLLVGSILVMLAVVTTFRGSIVNNLWWVVIVTLMSTAIGLAIAVLADGVRFEKVAKSIIFMPMAISLVGASVIWRFMYVARDSSKEQTGVLNGLWVGLGRASTGREIATVALTIVLGLLAVSLFSSLSKRRPHQIGMVGGAAFVAFVLVAFALGRWLLVENNSTVSPLHARLTWLGIIIGLLVGVALLALAVRRDMIGTMAGLVYVPIVGAVLWSVAWLWGGKASGDVQKWIIGLTAVAILLATLAAVARALTKRNWGGAAFPAVLAGLAGWFTLRYFAAWGGGIGGQEINTVGNIKSSPVNFIQESPFNSMFLMVVLIWIQTGFAMVILSAAIKAVPTELIEAAKVDGATESQVFWRVTLPQIAPTIGVVVTTIIVLVMKVYDIVNVMTNGNFETQILANDMFFQAFQSQNQGQGAALAILIFVSVLPVMIFNIRKMQKEN
jgi:ABC-type sugar transport system permease subunit